MKQRYICSVWKLTPPQVLVLGFALIILLGACLLMLPISNVTGEPLPFIDAWFTATSATCVTGLIVVDTGTTFTVFGQVVILLLIQIGGLGFMTMATLFAFALKKKISLKERLILQEAWNQGSMEGIVRLIRKVVLFAVCIEGVAVILFSVRWAFDFPLGQAIYFGIFHAVSLFNNAGFDVFGSVSGPFTSLTRYVGDPFINVVAILLIIIGGIGFIVLSDIVEYRHTRKLCLHTKIVLTMTGLLIVLGTMVIFIFEFTNSSTFGQLSGGDKFWAALFQSVSVRTAGMNTINIADMRQASQFFMIILMFIGASPGSTGGGIKTTTFAILVGAVLAMIWGKEDIVIYRYRLGKDRIFKAVTLTLLALFLLIIITMILSTTENHDFLTVLFEATSAFGTVGLTMGLTTDLSNFSKVLLCVTMFAGRLGPLTLAYALGPKNERELYRHPEGKITIG